MIFRNKPTALLLIALGCDLRVRQERAQVRAGARRLPPSSRLWWSRPSGSEKVLIKAIQQRTPLVETYIQNTRPDVKLYQVPVSDQYMLSRVDFGKGFFDKTYRAPPRIEEGRLLQRLAGCHHRISPRLWDWTRSSPTIPLGFMQMMFLDPSGFDEQHYVFSYVRREFLGSVRTWVFDVHPKVAGMGRFYGRIWIEDQDGNIVRFNGTFTAAHRTRIVASTISTSTSWRMNVQPGIWLPVAVYVEETNAPKARRPSA